MKYLLVLLVLLATNCSHTDDAATQEVEEAALATLANEIRVLADASVCSENYTCYSIGFGSKPCGGHWEYLAYSNSIDVAEFSEKVDSYNKLEKKFNTKYGITSDCSVVIPPELVTCENGKCKVLYN